MVREPHHDIPSPTKHTFIAVVGKIRLYSKKSTDLEFLLIDMVTTPKMAKMVLSMLLEISKKM
jgi:hypothetical protein